MDTNEHDVWGPYVNYDDAARLEYTRLLWRSKETRDRFLAHWLDERHPHRERFIQKRTQIEEALETAEPDHEFDARLRARGESLRTLAREIPPVFGSFF